MKAIGAREAQNNFGALMDAAQREPVMIEKYGRPSAVILSAQEYNEIKLEQLRARLAIGEAQAERGELSDQTVDEVLKEFKTARDGK